MNWYDAVVWCNALTEYYAAKGGTSYQCVYYHDSAYTTPIRSTSDSSKDVPCINAAAKGFHLPTGNEWELAARYIVDKLDDHILGSLGEYYPGDFASGADAACDASIKDPHSDCDGDGDVNFTKDVAVFSATSTAPVKSKSPNKLGLYDMSGNAAEWCFDESGGLRMYRGGSQIDNADNLRVGVLCYVKPDSAGGYIGFRPARTQ